MIEWLEKLKEDKVIIDYKYDIVGDDLDIYIQLNRPIEYISIPINIKR